MVQSVFEDIQVSGIMTAVPKHRNVLLENYKEVFGEEAVVSFSKTVGVIERRIALEEQTASDLAFVAARELLKEKGINKDEIEILIFVTGSPDYRVPATACVLHKRLELPKDCIVFDVNLGCSGYVYGMEIACSLLKSIAGKYGLLLVGDTINKAIAPEDRASAMLFGDSASATLLEQKKNVKKIYTSYRTDGSGFKSIIIPAGCYRNRGADTERTVWADGNKRSDYDLYLNGIEVFTFAISEVPDSIKQFLEFYDVALDSYDAYILHQANCYMLKQIIKRSKMLKEKVPISMDRYGNTGVTSIPLTICDEYGEKCGDKEISFLTCGFGIGQSWGITSFWMNQKDIFPIIETDEYYTEGSVSHD